MPILLTLNHISLCKSYIAPNNVSRQHLIGEHQYSLEHKNYITSINHYPQVEAISADMNVTYKGTCLKLTYQLSEGNLQRLSPSFFDPQYAQPDQEYLSLNHWNANYYAYTNFCELSYLFF
ncbi:hypothetical protein A6R68_24299, partial [Neotoma lepida]